MIRIIVMYALLIPCVTLFIYEKNKGEIQLQKILASIFKGMAIWIILCGALAGTLGRGEEPHVYMLLISAGLAMGLAGDVALSITGEHGFMSGMLFFGLGHLSYIAAFILISTWSLLAVPIFLISYTIALIVLIRMKKNGKCPEELFVPVLVYMGIILAMVSLSATMPVSTFPRGFILLVAAVLFAVSDAMLAQNKFASVIEAKAAANKGIDTIRLTPVERGTISLCCYFLAQSLFAVSIYFLF